MFRGVESNPDQVFCKIKNLVTKNIRSIQKGQQPQNEWEDLVILDWNLKDINLIQIGPNLRDLARWDCPPMDWYKIKFDGA